MLFKIQNYVNGKVFSISLKIVKFKTRKNTWQVNKRRNIYIYIYIY